MAGIRGLLIDLDGVIYTGETPIPGAAGTISWLREEGYPFRFVSNSTRRSAAGIAGKLAAMGIPAGNGAVVTPAVAAAALARQRGWSRVFPVTTAEVAEDFRAAGIEPCGDSCDFIAVGDCGDFLTYSLLNRAFRLALDGVPILALEKDRFFRDSDGLSLSAGPFVAALEYATGRQAELVGKPSPQYFLGALSAIGIPPAEAAMVGDDPVSDVEGAMETGMAGILVLTGKSSAGVPASWRKPPTAVLPSIAALPGYLSGLEEG